MTPKKDMAKQDTVRDVSDAIGDIKQLKLLMKDLGEKLGVPDLSINDEGYGCLSVDEKMIVHIQLEADRHQVLFFADVGKIPEGKEDEVYKDLLEANLFWCGTSGCTFGVDPTSKVVILAYREPIGGIDLERFQKILESVINSTEYWMERIIKGKPAQAPAPSASPREPGAFRV